MKSHNAKAFQAKVSEVRALLKSGLPNDATKSLDDAWTLAGDSKPARTVAHDLGNEIQIALFEQYEACNAN